MSDIDKDQPVLPYGGDEDPNSGYAAGVATSSERAHRDDRDGTTAGRQRITLALLENQGWAGLTWKELAEKTGWHHGQASGVLSVLHKENVIDRLTERRDRCFVYVRPRYVNGRETQQQGRKMSAKVLQRRLDLIRELAESQSFLVSEQVIQVLDGVHD